MRNHTRRLGIVLVVGGTVVGSAWATPDEAKTWHARLGAGLNPLFTSQQCFPKAKSGFGASLSGFVQLPYRLSAGAGFDWEQYRFDSVNIGDLPTDQPRYVDEALTFDPASPGERGQVAVSWHV